jgi:hypothetical protein
LSGAFHASALPASASLPATRLSPSQAFSASPPFALTAIGRPTRALSRSAPLPLSKTFHRSAEFPAADARAGSGAGSDATGLGVAASIGIAAGCVALLVLVGLFLWRRRRAGTDVPLELVNERNLALTWEGELDQFFSSVFPGQTSDTGSRFSEIMTADAENPFTNFE